MAEELDNPIGSEAMAEPQDPITHKLLIISVDENFTAAIEENPFPPFIIASIADWLAIQAEAEMFGDLTEDEETEDDGA